jgi:hypothetical protein
LVNKKEILNLSNKIRSVIYGSWALCKGWRAFFG